MNPFGPDLGKEDEREKVAKDFARKQREKVGKKARRPADKPKKRIPPRPVPDGGMDIGLGLIEAEDYLDDVDLGDVTDGDVETAFEVKHEMDTELPRAILNPVDDRPVEHETHRPAADPGKDSDSEPEPIAPTGAEAPQPAPEPETEAESISEAQRLLKILHELRDRVDAHSAQSDLETDRKDLFALQEELNELPAKSRSILPQVDFLLGIVEGRIGNVRELAEHQQVMHDRREQKLRDAEIVAATAGTADEWKAALDLLAQAISMSSDVEPAIIEKQREWEERMVESMNGQSEADINKGEPEAGAAGGPSSAKESPDSGAGTKPTPENHVVDAAREGDSSSEKSESPHGSKFAEAAHGMIEKSAAFSESFRNDIKGLLAVIEAMPDSKEKQALQVDVVDAIRHQMWNHHVRADVSSVDHRAEPNAADMAGDGASGSAAKTPGSEAAGRSNGNPDEVSNNTNNHATRAKEAADPGAKTNTSEKRTSTPLSSAEELAMKGMDVAARREYMFQKRREEAIKRIESKEERERAAKELARQRANSGSDSKHRPIPSGPVYDQATAFYRSLNPKEGSNVPQLKTEEKEWWKQVKEPVRAETKAEKQAREQEEKKLRPQLDAAHLRIQEVQQKLELLAKRLPNEKLPEELALVSGIKRVDIDLKDVDIAQLMSQMRANLSHSPDFKPLPVEKPNTVYGADSAGHNYAEYRHRRNGSVVYEPEMAAQVKLEIVLAVRYEHLYEQLRQKLDEAEASRHGREVADLAEHERASQRLDSWVAKGRLFSKKMEQLYDHEKPDETSSVDEWSKLVTERQSELAAMLANIDDARQGGEALKQFADNQKKVDLPTQMMRLRQICRTQAENSLKGQRRLDNLSPEDAERLIQLHMYKRLLKRLYHIEQDAYRALQPEDIFDVDFVQAKADFQEAERRAADEAQEIPEEEWNDPALIAEAEQAELPQRDKPQQPKPVGQKLPGEFERVVPGRASA